MRKRPPRTELLHVGLASVAFAVVMFVGALVMVVLCFYLENTPAVFSAAEVKRLTALVAALMGTLGIVFIVIATLTLKNRKYLPDGSTDPVVGQQALCAECHGMFNIQNMIEHQGLHICARCKPIFLQKLAEGATPTPGSAPENSQPLL